jgi:hypothetical protein
VSFHHCSIYILLSVTDTNNPIKIASSNDTHNSVNPDFSLLSLRPTNRLFCLLFGYSTTPSKVAGDSEVVHNLGSRLLTKPIIHMEQVLLEKLSSSASQQILIF